MKLNVSRIFISLILAICFSPATVICAQEYTIEATGIYMMGDGPDENVNTAKERARTEALRQASEQAGVYVESYSKSQNLSLLCDEIDVVSAQVCKVKRTTIEPQIVNNHIQWKCSITAVVDTSNINLKAILSDRQAVAKVKELQQTIKTLQTENNKLKAQYIQSVDTHSREELNRKIQENGRMFNEAVQKLPVYVWGRWQPGIDVGSVQYDKENQTITFQSRINSSKNNGSYDISCFKIYINRNSVEGLWAAYYSYDGATPQYFKGGKQLERPIEPESYQEILQNRLYNYLGVTDTKINCKPDWRYIYTVNLKNGVQYPCYVDFNNYRYDKQKNICIAFTKMIISSDGYVDIGQYCCDFNRHSVGVSETAYGDISHWDNIDFESTDLYWELEKKIYEAAKTICKV